LVGGAVAAKDLAEAVAVKYTGRKPNRFFRAAKRERERERESEREKERDRERERERERRERERESGNTKRK
jgi:hypothetical protein